MLEDLLEHGADQLDFFDQGEGQNAPIAQLVSLLSCLGFH